MCFCPCLWKMFGFLKRPEIVQNDFVAVERGKSPTNPDFTQPLFWLFCFQGSLTKMTITGKREGWRLSPFTLVFLAFDAIYQRLSSSRSAVSPFKPEAGSLLPVRREGSTSAFRNRIACPDDTGHRDVTSCKTRGV